MSPETLHTWELLGQTLSEGSQGIFQVPDVEVRVNLGGRDLCMGQHLRHDVNRYTSLYQIASRAVSQRMKSGTHNLCPFQCLQPCGLVMTPRITSTSWKEVPILAGA